MELNLYHLTDEERIEKGIKSLPASLGEAIQIAEKSELLKETLGDHTFKRFIELKKKEWDEFRIQVTEYEITDIVVKKEGMGSKNLIPFLSIKVLKI